MMHYVLAGTMHMSVPGFEPIVCGPGCIVLIPPGLPLFVSADDGPPSDATDVIAEKECFISRDGVLVCDAADGAVGDLRYMSGIVLASYSGSFGLLDNVKRPISQNLSDNELIQHAYTAMMNEMGQPRVGGRALTSALMKACLVLVIREFIAGAEPGNETFRILADPQLRKAIDAILDCPSDAHTVADLAALAGMSRSTFARQFASAFGMGPMEFVAKTRLYHGAQLLRSTPLSVKVIAATAGFASRSHFSRAFKEGWGMDPTAFREKHRSGAIDPPRPTQRSS
jgi:AraC-like DNA-binding protein